MIFLPDHATAWWLATETRLCNSPLFWCPGKRQFSYDHFSIDISHFACWWRTMWYQWSFYAFRSITVASLFLPEHQFTDVLLTTVSACLTLMCYIFTVISIWQVAKLLTASPILAASNSGWKWTWDFWQVQWLLMYQGSMAWHDENPSGRPCTLWNNIFCTI